MTTWKDMRTVSLPLAHEDLVKIDLMSREAKLSRTACLRALIQLGLGKVEEDRGSLREASPKLTERTIKKIWVKQADDEPEVREVSSLSLPEEVVTVSTPSPLVDYLDVDFRNPPAPPVATENVTVATVGIVGDEQILDQFDPEDFVPVPSLVKDPALAADETFGITPKVPEDAELDNLFSQLS